ncbi:Tetratricopeptide repeat like superfamily protein [Klebsormidium nitens]|uniref:Tetratricopeptide repeat like superfamily protein n=1 Tax=Klebsormidium nitens TaxID=105231 RepID=A0A1Y1HIT8_KLENI|nr:Tetratricopeptide repeat like superfamily protein [Klebsormidium nitens]|eukprot:GAQ78424.1 Tetratricopeptide repeat like superfamily protein [Klebsormidium nitens]
MAGHLNLVDQLPAGLLEKITDADWATDARREQSCGLVGEFLSRQADFASLVGQLTQVEGSPLEKFWGGAEEWRKRGNEAFKIGARAKAVECYTKALQFAPSDGASGSAPLAPLFSNRAAALEKLGEAAAALTDCARAIEVDPQFSKAWYRRGKARAALKDLSGAVGDLETALEIESGGSSSPELRGGGVGAKVKSLGKGVADARRDTSKSGAEATKGVVASGSAKQIAIELEKVRALLASGEHPAKSDDAQAATRQKNPERGKVAHLESLSVSEFEFRQGLEQPTSLLAGAEVFHHSGSGRGLRGTRSFAPGDVVLAEEPFAAVLLKERRATHCHHCFKALPLNSLPCSGCAGPLFCRERCRDAALERALVEDVTSKDTGEGEEEVERRSAERRSIEPDRVADRSVKEGSKRVSDCERSESGQGAESKWNGEHAHECGGASWAAILPLDAVLAVRVLARLGRKQAAGCDGPVADDLGASKVSSLCHHLDRVPTSERPTLLVLACTAARCAQASGNDVTPADVLLTIGRLRANVMAVNDVTWTAGRSEERAESPFQGANGATERERAKTGSAGNHTETLLSGKNGEAEVGRHPALKDKSRDGFLRTEGMTESQSKVDPSLVFEQVQLGQALYPTASLLNHSCDPSAAVSFAGDRVCVRAVKRLQPGEELTLSYGPQKGETRTADRRKWLWERYAFVCNCGACAGDQTSDVLMTGLKCPQSKCGGVVPQHSAVGTFRFLVSGDALQPDEDRAATNGAPSSLPLVPPPETAVTETELDTSGRVQTETQSGQASGVVDAKEGVCSDCDLDPPDVVCRECGGRLLCLECDSHVHQLRSKRRGGHVRERIRSKAGSGEKNFVGGSEGSREASEAAVDSVSAEDSIGKDRKQTESEALGAQIVARTANSPAEKEKVSSMKVEDRNKEHDRTDCETDTTDRSTGAGNALLPSQTSGSREAVPTAGGSSKATQHTSIQNNPVLITEPASSPIDSNDLSKVERGRCAACGTVVDVSEIIARVEAAWAAAKGRMPYLEAAEEAHAVATGALHPLNRKLAEYEDHLAEACAQAGRQEDARRHCRRSVQILEYHYPRGSLPLAHEFAKLSSIARAAADGDEAAQMARKAEAILKAHYGSI